MPGNGGGPEGPTACSALCSKGIFPASSRPPCTKRRLSVRLGGGYLAFSAHSCDILSYLIRFPAACQEVYCQFCAPGTYWALAEGPGGPVRRPCGFTRTHLNNGRAGEDARPYENTGSCPVNAAGGRSQTGLPSSFNHRPHENSWESGFEFYANKRHLKPSCFRCRRFLCRMDGAKLKTHHI